MDIEVDPHNNSASVTYSKHGNNNMEEVKADVNTFEVDEESNYKYMLNINGNEWLRSNRRIFKNLLVLGFAWIFLFTAYSSVANLQSSLNSDAGLGTASLSTIYVALVISCLFIPPAMIKHIGLKYTIIISQCTYVLFIAANMYPRFYTMIPAAIILGAGAAPLWTAKCTYLTETGGFYSLLSGETSEAVVNRFFGIFFAMFQTAQIWGNIISSTVLKQDSNSTITDVSFCGAKDCPISTNSTDDSKKPNINTVYILCGIYLTVAVISIILLLFLLDNYKRNAPNEKKESVFSLKLLVITVSHLKNKYQLLIIPLTLWSGFEQAFISADFTKSYVTCTKGISYVGWTMICLGISDALGSYGFGFIVKYVGRVPCFLIAATFNYAMIFTMIFWHPTPDQTIMLFVIPAIWGLGDAVWQTQINALYGVLFQDSKEAAFSNYRLWESLGFAVAYAYSGFTCVSIKLYLLLAYLTIGMICYCIIELMEKSKRNSKVIATNK